MPVKFDKIQVRPDFVDEVYRVLLDAISDGSLAPGVRLTQEEIAEQFAVSRSPVLQALRLLKKDGLVQDASGAASLSSPAEKPRPAAPAARGRGRVGQISPPHPPLPCLHRRGPGSIGGRLLPTAPRPPPAQGEALGPGG